MKKQMRKILTAMTTIVLAVSLLSVTARADQPQMEAAKDNLDDAMKYLNKASADKGGHRKRAMELVAEAKTAVNNGINYDRTHLTIKKGRKKNSDFETDFFAPANFPPPDQPNMEKARGYLQTALGNLNRASADKGGYRKQAMNLVQKAINEINLGIEYDRTH